MYQPETDQHPNATTRNTANRGKLSLALAASIAILTLCTIQTSAAAYQPDAGTPSIPPTTPSTENETEDLTEEALANYLEGLGLDALLAEHLLLRVSSATGPDRRALAERLGRVYARLLTKATSTEERQRWENHSRRLLSLVPDAETYELRINLARAVYTTAEATLERSRLGLATEQERAEALRTMADARTTLVAVARRTHQRVDSLERRERRGDEDPEFIEQLSNARRLRSLAYYYAGWCAYYIAWGSGDLASAREAQEHFGWLLGSPGSSATLDRAPGAMMRYEHIARAAMGAGLAASVLSRDAEALAWFDLIENQPDAPPAVVEQLLGRRIAVLARAGRWADLLRAVERARDPARRAAQSSPTTPRTTPPRPSEIARQQQQQPQDQRQAPQAPIPLQTAEARQLAIVTLGADRRFAADLLDRLATIAMADLVARGEVAHVLDIIKQFGTAPLGDDGFIPIYVRGLQLYQQAREEHEQSSDPHDEPAKGATAAIYARAAAQLRSATIEPDAANYRSELDKARLQLGLALYYAGRLVEASNVFEQAAESANTDADRQEAHWRALVALDRLDPAADSPQARRRAQLAILFIQRYPSTERAGRLILTRATGDLIDDATAAQSLLDIPQSSPVYEPARRLAARLLYREFIRSRGSARAIASARFLNVAEEVLATDRNHAERAEQAEAREAAERAFVLARQMLDAALTPEAPDPPRADLVLNTIDQLVSLHNLSTDQHRDELLYRRFQLALARGNDRLAASYADQLSAIGGRYARAAEQLYFRLAASAWRRTPTDPDRATAVVRFGQRLANSLESEPASAPARLAVLNDVAAAAYAAWIVTNDPSLRDAAITADTIILEARPNAGDALERLAVCAEDAGNTDLALQCWRQLLLGRDRGSTPWHEARYHSLRILAQSNPIDALRAYRQHTVLYPSIGPEPWGDRLRALGRQLEQQAGQQLDSETNTGGQQ